MENATMENVSDDQSAPYVDAQRGPQLTIFHLFGMIAAIAGAILGCKYGFRHGGMLAAVGSTVTGFLIGGALCFPFTFVLITLISIPELIRSAARGLFRKLRGVQKDA